MIRKHPSFSTRNCINAFGVCTRAEIFILSIFPVFFVLQRKFESQDRTRTCSKCDCKVHKWTYRFNEITGVTMDTEQFSRRPHKKIVVYNYLTLMSWQKLQISIFICFSTAIKIQTHTFLSFKICFWL